MQFFRKLSNAIQNLFNSSPSHLSSEIEDLLILADFGPDLAQRLAQQLGQKHNIAEVLKTTITDILSPLISDFNLDSIKAKPIVIAINGSNGCGKTTTIAKLISKFQQTGRSVSVAACDTFRAGAVEQLVEWGTRLNAQVFKSSTQSPSSLAFSALQNNQSDILLIDTAGRMTTNTNLMNELKNIYKALRKCDPLAPHLNILVLDATIGQSAYAQVKAFNELSPINGLILSKMDGPSKGGTIVKIAKDFCIPILAVGTGEHCEDLEPFDLEKFLQGIL